MSLYDPTTGFELVRRKLHLSEGHIAERGCPHVGRHAGSRCQNRFLHRRQRLAQQRGVQPGEALEQAVDRRPANTGGATMKPL